MVARYKENTERKHRNFNLAKKFYTLALHLQPNFGNAYNQLAVLAVLENGADYELAAIDMYLRRFSIFLTVSLVVKTPFTTALDNLQILFGKAGKSENGSIALEFVVLHSLLLPASREYSIKLTNSVEKYNLEWRGFSGKIQNLINTNSISTSTLETLFVTSIDLYTALTTVGALKQEVAQIQGLQMLILAMCDIIIDKVESLLNDDFESLTARYESFLGLVKLVVRVVESSLFSRDHTIETRNRVGAVATLLAVLVGERYPGANPDFCPMLEDEKGLVGVVGLDTSLVNPADVLNERMEEGEKVRVRCNQILFGVKRMCRKEVFLDIDYSCCLKKSLKERVSLLLLNFQKLLLCLRAGGALVVSRLNHMHHLDLKVARLDIRLHLGE